MRVHEVTTSPGYALVRTLALLLAAVALVMAVAPAAVATEESTAAADEEALTYAQLQQDSSQRAQEFFPDPYAEPSFFQWINIPVMLAGLVIAVLMLGAYLWWQPKFAAERREKQRR